VAPPVATESHVALACDLPIVEAKFVGLVGRDELFRIVSQGLELARTHGVHRHLVDCTELEGGHSLADLFNIAKTIVESPARGLFREALLSRPGSPVDHEISFFQTTARNRGLDVRCFAAREEAVAWLIK